MGIIVLDANLIIDLFNNRLLTEETDKLNQLVNDSLLVVSQITRIEVLAGIHKEKQPQKVIKFLNEVVVVPLSNDFEETVITIRREYSIKLPDAIIAATALYLDATLITSDLRGFGRINGLRVWTPERT
jgi:predicted nucleic acid-binding protein